MKVNILLVFQSLHNIFGSLIIFTTFCIGWDSDQCSYLGYVLIFPMLLLRRHFPALLAPNFSNISCAICNKTLIPFPRLSARCFILKHFVLCGFWIFVRSYLWRSTNLCLSFGSNSLAFEQVTQGVYLREVLILFHYQSWPDIISLSKAALTSKGQLNWLLVR